MLDQNDLIQLSKMYKFWTPEAQLEPMHVLIFTHSYVENQFVENTKTIKPFLLRLTCIVHSN
jgi:hypothetical protein